MKLKPLLALLFAMCIVLCSCAHSVAEPVSVDMLMADALRFCEEGNYEEAILLYEEIIKIEPKNTKAKIELIRAYEHAGEKDKAAEALRKLDSAGVNLYDGDITEPHIDNTEDTEVPESLPNDVIAPEESSGSELYAEYFLGKSVQDVFDMGYTTELSLSPYFEGFYDGSLSNRDYNPVLQTDAYQVSFEEINAVFEVGSSAEGFVPEDVIMAVELFNNRINTVSIYPGIDWNTSREKVKEVIGANFETYEATVVRNYITDEMVTYFIDWIRKGDLVITLWRTNAADKDIQAAVVFKQVYEDYAMDCLSIGPYVR